MTGFECTTFGKWILAGEHAVLRGGAALVFPLVGRQMSFSWIPSEKPFTVEFNGGHSQELHLIFFGLLEAALKDVNMTREDLKGDLQIHCELPLGAGLGASAALCVGVGRLFLHLQKINEDQLFEFSRRLENLFHGESSGVDIAIAIAGSPLRFERGPQGGGERQPLQVQWRPNWYLSYSGKRGVTSECVKKVSQLWQTNARLGEKIDLEMREAVALAEKALGMSDAAAGLDLLARSIDHSRDAFYQWGLCEGPLGKHVKAILGEGALSAKPTGSGGGGYALSLWSEPPSAAIVEKLGLIPV